MPLKIGFFGNIFKTYTPRRVCMNYESDVIWLHFWSDLAISLAYFTIPAALLYFVVIYAFSLLAGRLERRLAVSGEGTLH